MTFLANDAIGNRCRLMVEDDPGRSRVVETGSVVTLVARRRRASALVGLAMAGLAGREILLRGHSMLGWIAPSCGMSRCGVAERIVKAAGRGPRRGRRRRLHGGVRAVRMALHTHRRISLIGVRMGPRAASPRFGGMRCAHAMAGEAGDQSRTSREVRAVA